MAVEMRLISRGLKVIMLVTIASKFIVVASEENIHVRVNRRLHGDIYYLSTTFHSCPTNLSYLVSEDRCVEDQELFSGNAHNHCNGSSK